MIFSSFLATKFQIRWSSKWTWGGTGTPLADEMVNIWAIFVQYLSFIFQIVITEGQTILLDTDTPILFFLLINGGTLMFDKEAPSIELNSKYILVAGGGKLIIGTEEEPYENKATVTMHGNVRCTEMPVFGCKVKIYPHPPAFHILCSGHWNPRGKPRYPWQVRSSNLDPFGHHSLTW